MAAEGSCISSKKLRAASTHIRIAGSQCSSRMYELDAAPALECLAMNAAPPEEASTLPGQGCELVRAAAEAVAGDPVGSTMPIRRAEEGRMEGRGTAPDEGRMERL